ncbi:MAG TPA: GAF domain-containing SpoIIE family protein phosphatase [Bacteroidota bacterium]|nr:GAF domain-containing SpoIIE family protein phosphatase [Bacteroidota bacterium]
MTSPQSLQEETQRLKRAVEELSILNDLARAIGSTLNLEEIMQTIIRRSLRAVQSEQGVITLVDKKSSEPTKTLVRAMVSSSDHVEFHLHQALLGWMHLNMKPLLVDNPKQDERFRGVHWDESVNSLLCVPLLVKSELRGVLTVYNKKEGKKFNTDDQRLLAIIAGQSAQVIDNARLYEEEKHYLIMQEEVRLAAKIQMDLLPTEMPKLGAYEIVGKTIPAQTVGGDYFDFIKIDDHRLAICLGDVTGKGLPASLLMANLQATLRGQTLVAREPRECLTRSNKLLYESTSPEKFATLFYGILDNQTHSLAFSNAGHDHPFLISTDGTFKRLSAGGMMLGAFDTFDFDDENTPVQPGDTLVIYSDGIPEAMDASGVQYGEERLMKFLIGHRDNSPGELLDALVRDVEDYAGAHPQSDDMTIVVIKRPR